MVQDGFRVDVVCDVLNKLSTSECDDVEEKAELLSEFLEGHGLDFPYDDSGSAFADAGMRCHNTTFPATFFHCFKRFVAHIFLNQGEVRVLCLVVASEAGCMHGEFLPLALENTQSISSRYRPH